MNKIVKGLFAVASADSEWGIGYHGELLARVSKDMKTFRSLTTGKAVILGSKTLKTFPGGRPLKNRTNIILTRNPDFGTDGAVVCHGIDEVLSKITGETAVIGGEQIYRQLLPYCERAYITRFRHSFEKDAFFPDLDSDRTWKLIGIADSFVSEDTDSISGMQCDLCVYGRVYDEN